MHSPSRRPHLVRGTSAAAIATFASLFSHVLAGGDVPGSLGIVTPFLLSLMVCILLAGRELSLGRLSISVVASQTLFHTLFVLGTPAAGSAATSAASGAHNHGAMAMPMQLPTASTLALVQADTTMWASHAIGAVVTVVFLYRGERAIHALRALAERLACWIRHRLTAPLRLQISLPPRAPHAVESSGWVVLTQLTRSSLRRRGPPRAPVTA